MKKVLGIFVVCCILAVATSASALEVLGGRLGAGVEQIEPGYGVGYLPFISFDPIPSLQLRLGAYLETDPVTSSNPYADSYTILSLTGLYRLWNGNWAPHVGLKLSFENDAVNLDDPSPTAGYRDLFTAGSLILGVEWNILNNVSLFIDTNVINAYTGTRNGDLYEAHSVSLGNVFVLGGVVYLD